MLEIESGLVSANLSEQVHNTVLLHRPARVSCIQTIVE